MSGFLLDTNVISILSPTRTDASPKFLDWLERMDREGRVYLSVVSIHEVEKGIALLDHNGATSKAAGLRVWLSGLIAAFDDKIFGVDVSSAAQAGQLEAKAISAGDDPGMADATIAGIANAHDLTIITLNTKHFLAFGSDVSSPDEAVSLP